MPIKFGVTDIGCGYLGTDAVSKIMLGNELVKDCSMPIFATAVPVDFVATCGIECLGDFIVDWGDGTLTSYSNTTASVIPTGNIIIYSTNVTYIRFHTDTFSEIEIVDGTNLTTFNSMCVNLSNLVTFNATNTHNVTAMTSCFSQCGSLTNLGLFDTSSVKSWEVTFANCSSLTVMPKFDMSAGNSYSECFRAGAVSVYPDWVWNTTELINMSGAFQSSKITTITASWVFTMFSDCHDMFEGTLRLVSVPDLNMPNVLNMQNMFSRNTGIGTQGLKSIGVITCPICTDFNRMFNNSDGLECIGGIDTRAQTDTALMFNNNPLLSAPDAAEQTTIAAGTLYTNPGACP